MKIPAIVLCLMLAACASNGKAQLKLNQQAKLDSTNIATYSFDDEPAMYEDPDFFFNLLVSEVEYNDSQKALIELGRQYLAADYKFGGNTEDEGFDCSSFTQFLYKKALDKNLPRTALEMASVGKSVDKNQLVAGDLVFFNTRGFKFSHVGIYIGDGRFFHASTKAGAIIIGNIDNEYFAKRYNGARRILG